MLQIIIALLHSVTPFSVNEATRAQRAKLTETTTLAWAWIIHFSRALAKINKIYFVHWALHASCWNAGWWCERYREKRKVRGGHKTITKMEFVIFWQRQLVIHLANEKKKRNNSASIPRTKGCWILFRCNYIACGLSFAFIFFFQRIFVWKSFLLQQICAVRFDSESIKMCNNNLFTGICWRDRGTTTKMRAEHQHLLYFICTRPVICGCGCASALANTPPPIAWPESNGEHRQHVHETMETFKWINNNIIFWNSRQKYANNAKFACRTPTIKSIKMEFLW